MWSKTLKRMFVASLVLVAATVGTAAANGEPHERRGDRVVMKAKKQARLLKYDLDKNGVLDDNEKHALRADRLARKFDKLDANRDGVLSKAEYASSRHARGTGKHQRGAGKHHRGHRGHRGDMMGS